MKRYLSLLMGILGFVPILAQQSDYYYYYKGNRIDLTVDSTRLYVVSEGELQLQSTTRSADPQIVKSVKSNIRNQVVPLQKQRAAFPEIYFSTLNVPEGQSPAQYAALVAKVKSENEVYQVFPSFTIDGESLNVTNNFYVKLKSHVDFDKLQEMAAKYNIEVIGHHEHLLLWYMLSCNKSSTLNALDAANLFHMSGEFACSEPGLCGVITPHSIDPYYVEQWNLKNTGDVVGTSGMDINVEEAWEITKGEGVVIAIYDEAIYPEHPDLQGNIISGGYDIGTGDVPYYDLSSSGNHGNGSAGVIAAVQDNGIGLSGVSPKSKIMSIAYNGEFNEYEGWQMSSGITESVARGADVINCAWDFGVARNGVFEDAFEYALDEGRDGKGCVVVCAAGNYDDSNNIDTLKMKVKYPGDSNPRILTVGGMTAHGERLIDGRSLDYYSFYGSCFGEELDVVAPAMLVYSIYRDPNTGVSKYSSDFSGTSAACAHASGVAALILSVHPELTADQVVSIIEYTAKKILPDLYTYQTTESRPCGGWNEEVGYGLIDAGAAVSLADKATRTTWVTNTVITGAEHYYDYVVEVEDVVVEDGGMLELDKDRSVIIKRNVVVRQGGQFIVYKDPDFLN